MNKDVFSRFQVGDIVTFSGAKHLYYIEADGLLHGITLSGTYPVTNADAIGLAEFEVKGKQYFASKFSDGSILRLKNKKGYTPLYISSNELSKLKFKQYNENRLQESATPKSGGSGSEGIRIHNRKRKIKLQVMCLSYKTVSRGTKTYA